METHTFGPWLREYRRKYGIRAVDIASSAGISDAFLRLVETEQRNLSFQSAAAILAGLGCTVDDLHAAVWKVTDGSRVFSIQSPVVERVYHDRTSAHSMTRIAEALERIATALERDQTPVWMSEALRRVNTRMTDRSSH